MDLADDKDNKESIWPGRQSTNNTVGGAIEATEKVQEQLDETLGDYVDIVYIFLGMVPNASRRIITEINGQSDQEHCAVLHASRVFSTGLSAFILLRKGLIIDAITLVRSVLEGVTQSILFLRDPQAASAWLAGKRYSPSDVRKKLTDIPIKKLYDALTTIAHHNQQAIALHSIQVEEGYAISYSGSYRPKGAAKLIAVLIDIILIYLHQFYIHYRGRLSVDAWPLMIDLGTKMNQRLRDWTDTLPEDQDTLAPYAATWKTPPMPPSVIDADTLKKVLEVISKDGDLKP